MGVLHRELWVLLKHCEVSAKCVMHFFVTDYFSLQAGATVKKIFVSPKLILSICQNAVLAVYQRGFQNINLCHNFVALWKVCKNDHNPVNFSFVFQFHSYFSQVYSYPGFWMFTKGRPLWSFTPCFIATVIGRRTGCNKETFRKWSRVSRGKDKMKWSVKLRQC